MTLKSSPAASTIAARCRSTSATSRSRRRLELVPVDPDADVLHAGEHADERDLDVVVERAQALGVEGGEERRDQPVDGQRAAGRRGGARRGRSLEVELARRGDVAVGDASAGVADEQLLEQVAALGRVEEVGGQRGVERQAADVDVEAGEGAHERLGLVGGERPAADAGERAELGADLGVGEELAREPQHVAGVAVADEGQALEGRSALRAGPRGGQRQRRVAGARRRQGLDGGVGGGQRLDLRLEHDRLGRRRAQVGVEGLGQPVEQGVELEEVEEPADLVDVDGRRVEDELVDRRSSGTSRTRTITSSFWRTFASCAARFSRSFGRLLVEVLEDAVEPAVGGDQLGRRLLPHPGHARQVVGRVAAQRGVLRVERGRDAGALLDAGLVVERVVGHAALVVEHLDVRVLDELVAVAVAGDDDDVVARVAALRGERGDDVVGLDAGHLEDRDAERLDHLADQAHLLAQDVGRGVAVGLVGGDALVAERRLGPVEGHRDAVGLVVAHQVDRAST